MLSNFNLSDKETEGKLKLPGSLLSILLDDYLYGMLGLHATRTGMRTIAG
jgi:hypothetical protein